MSSALDMIALAYLLSSQIQEIHVKQKNKRPTPASIKARGLSIRQIKTSTKVSVGTIQKLLSKADAQGLCWPLPDGLDDNQLAQLFYPGADTRVSSRHQMPDREKVHQELKRKGMTKQLLWEEHTERYPNRCYSYSQFCDRYRHWCGQQKRSMRQVHKAGENCGLLWADRADC